jgi:hypothetical protein
MSCNMCETKFDNGSTYYTLRHMTLCSGCGESFGLLALAQSKVFIPSKIYRSRGQSIIGRLPKVKFEPCIKCINPIYVGDRFVIVQKPELSTLGKWQKEFSDLYGHRICIKCCRKLIEPLMPFNTYELGIKGKHPAELVMNSVPGYTMVDQTLSKASSGDTRVTQQSDLEQSWLQKLTGKLDV